MGSDDPVEGEPFTREQGDVDPDLVRDPHQGAVLGVVAVGGVIGAEARYGLSRLITHGPNGFPVSTLVINLIGSLLLGILMAVIARRALPPLTRPFVGVGVIGGFTTFSTFAVDIVGLLHHHAAATAAGYLAATLIGCALAVWLGDALVRTAAGPVR